MQLFLMFVCVNNQKSTILRRFIFAALTNGFISYDINVLRGI